MLLRCGAAHHPTLPLPLPMPLPMPMPMPMLAPGIAQKAAP